MITAFHDPALRHPVSRDGSWTRAVEFVCARNWTRTKTIYLYNRSSATILLKLEGNLSGFGLSLPPSVNLPPGVTPLTITVAAGALPLPTTVDFQIIGRADESRTGQSGYVDLDYTDDAYTLDSHKLGGTLLKIEATAFCLPVGDERFNDLNPSPLATVQDYAAYIAKGMGFVDSDYKKAVVDFLAEHLRDWSVWALNKHYLFNSQYGPMRHAQARAESIGYRPPGVANLHPALRRRVYAHAYEIARKHGSAEGIRAVFQALGIPQVQLEVWREGFTWYVRVPQWVASTYDIDFLSALALYHVDPYCVVNVAVNQTTLEHDFTDLDYVVEPGHAVQPPDPSGSDVVYHGTPVEYGGEQVVYTSDRTVTYGGEPVTYGGEEVTY